MNPSTRLILHCTACIPLKRSSASLSSSASVCCCHNKMRPFVICTHLICYGIASACFSMWDPFSGMSSETITPSVTLLATSPGPPGLPGPPGPKGDAGRNGINGQPGHHGLSGMPGHKGDTGRNGYPGNNGINGHNGHNGHNGINGHNGHNGRNGINGTERLELQCDRPCDGLSHRECHYNGSNYQCVCALGRVGTNCEDDYPVNEVSQICGSCGPNAVCHYIPYANSDPTHKDNFRCTCSQYHSGNPTSTFGCQVDRGDGGNDEGSGRRHVAGGHGGGSLDVGRGGGPQPLTNPQPTP